MFSQVSQATTEKSANYLYAWDYDVTLVSHSRWPPSRWGLRCTQIYYIQGRIQDFKLGGALKKIAPSGGRRENFWGISCEKSRFYAKNSYFFQLRREAWTFLGYFVWKITILRLKIIFFPILGGRPWHITNRFSLLLLLLKIEEDLLVIYKLFYLQLSFSFAIHHHRSIL
jgi:hypothetical protein